MDCECWGRRDEANAKVSGSDTAVVTENFWSSAKTRLNMMVLACAMLNVDFSMS